MTLEEKETFLKQKKEEISENILKEKTSREEARNLREKRLEILRQKKMHEAEELAKKKRPNSKRLTPKKPEAEASQKS
jgi:hypothetical protein